MYLKLFNDMYNIFSVVQGSDWYYGPTKSGSQPSYVRYSSLATFILALIFLFMYLGFQVCSCTYIYIIV